MSTSTIIEWVVVYGLAVVAPLALGGAVRWWVAAGVAALVSFQLPTGLGAAALVVPITGLAAVTAVGRLLRTPAEGVGVDLAADVLPAVWATVAAGSLVTSRGGWVLLDQEEPFVILTAVHYLFAGVGALTLAGQAGTAAGVVATAAAPPVVAIGFVAPSSGFLIAGAVLMTAGVWATAVAQLRDAATGRARRPLVRVLLAASALAVLAPMVLAILYAMSTRWPDVPHLGVTAMVPAHGLVNALGFVTLGLVARQLAARP